MIKGEFRLWLMIDCGLGVEGLGWRAAAYDPYVTRSPQP